MEPSAGGGCQSQLHWHPTLWLLLQCVVRCDSQLGVALWALQPGLTARLSYSMRQRELTHPPVPDADLYPRVVVRVLLL